MSAVISDPLQMVEAVAALRFRPCPIGGFQTLLDRNNEGEISVAERDELESFAELSEPISLG